MEIDVKHIAKLAMLRFSDEELADMGRELTGIVKMVEHLPDIESAKTLLEPDNLMDLREDTVIASYPREEMLANAPQTAQGCIVVPKTVE